MPTIGYDDEAMKIGARSFIRSRRFKLALLAWFIASIAMGATIAWLIK